MLEKNISKHKYALIRTSNNNQNDKRKELSKDRWKYQIVKLGIRAIFPIEIWKKLTEWLYYLWIKKIFYAIEFFPISYCLALNDRWLSTFDIRYCDWISINFIQTRQAFLFFISIKYSVFSIQCDMPFFDVLLLLLLMLNQSSVPLWEISLDQDSIENSLTTSNSVPVLIHTKWNCFSF